MNWIYKVSKALTSSSFFAFVLFSVLLYTSVLSFFISYKATILLASFPLEYLSYFSSNMFVITGIFFTITCLCVLIAWQYLYKIMTQFYKTQTVIKFISIYCSTLFVIISFFHFSTIFEYKEEYFQEIYLMKIYRHNVRANSSQQYENFDDFKKSYKIDNSEYSEFKFALTKILFDIKFSMIILLFCIASYFFVLLTKYEYKGLQKEQFYVEWYLSESLGWIKGTRYLLDEQLVVLKPEDCVKIINLKFDEEKEFYKHDLYDTFLKNVPISLLREASKQMYNMIKSCQVTYLHYDTGKINRCIKKYGELPEIVHIAKDERLY